jgi:hypothetical protein
MSSENKQKSPKSPESAESAETHQYQEDPFEFDPREHCSICHCHIGDNYCKNSNCGRHDIFDVGDAMMKLREFRRIISTHRSKVAQLNKSDNSSSKSLVNCGSEPANSSLYNGCENQECFGTCCSNFCKPSFLQQPSDNGGSAGAVVCEQKSSHNGGGACAEVCEQKSSHNGGGACAEVCEQKSSDNGGSACAEVCEQKSSDNGGSAGAVVCEKPPTCWLPNGAYLEKCCNCGANFVYQASDEVDANYCSWNCYGNR